jgi:phospholipid transport system substrate-binding protein
MRRNNRTGSNAVSGKAVALAASLALAAALAYRPADAAPPAAPATTAPAATTAPSDNATPTSGTPEVVDTDPGQLIDTAAKAMLADLDAHRAEYKKDPVKINALVDRILLPHFDTDYSARLVLGKHWSSASPEQRQRFVASFYHSLLANYGTALLDFTGDRLKVFPYKGAPGATSATVRTLVRKDDGSTVAVNYSLHHTDKGWMAWDVVIEGISYVKSFRDDFGAEIDQKGLDAVIARLEKQNGSPTVASKSASSK